VKLKRVGGPGGIALKTGKNEHMVEIQLNPQSGSSHTIIEREINTRQERKKRKKE